MKQLASLFLTLALIVSLLPPAHAAGGDDSGLTSMPKLSAQEITQLLAAHPTTMPSEAGEIFDVVPSTSAPYTAGKVKTELLQRTVDRLNALRAIAGVPAVTLDSALCENAQYGAVLLAASEFSHTPKKPADMDEAFYKEGYSATSSSNIYAGCALLGTPDGFMDDSDSSNIDRVGHRRWQLNPKLGKIGFGYALGGGYGRYTAEKVFDTSGAGGDYNFIAWPASGYFPTTLFGGDVAWSVSVNPEKYATPEQSRLSVTLHSEESGKTWAFTGSGSYSTSGEYFHVDTVGYGISNCIIFRPAGVSAYSGAYTVTIDGLKTKSGQSTSLSYEVNFFTPGEQPAPTDTSANNNTGNNTGNTTNTNNTTATNSGMPFVDVPQSAYYAPAVKWALEHSVTNGTSATTFSPNDTCTRGQVVTFLWRAQGCPEPRSTYNPFADVKASDYWYKPILWAIEQGITNGTSATTFTPNQTCSRAHIVTFLYRANGSPNQTGAGQWYDDAVNWAQGNGLLNGTAQAFYPGADCPRADVVTYLYRNETGDRSTDAANQTSSNADSLKDAWTGEREPRCYGFIVSSKEDVVKAFRDTLGSYPLSMSFFTKGTPSVLEGVVNDLKNESGEIGGLLTEYSGKCGLNKGTMSHKLDYSALSVEFSYDAGGVVQMYRKGVIDALPDKVNENSSRSADYNMLLRAVKEIESAYGVSGSSSDYDKVYAAYCYLSQNFKYDYALKNWDSSGNSYRDYGKDISEPYDVNLMLTNRMGICHNFAKTFEALCVAMGVECHYVTGWVKGYTVSHAWNLVKVDGQWYQADSCWDIYHKPGNFRYFLLSDKDIASDHKVDQSYYTKGCSNCPISYNHPNDAKHPATGGNTATATNPKNLTQYIIKTTWRVGETHDPCESFVRSDYPSIAAGLSAADFTIDNPAVVQMEEDGLLHVIGGGSVKIWAENNGCKCILEITVPDTGVNADAYGPNPKCGTYLGKNADGVMEFDLTVKKGSTEMYVPIVWNNAQGYHTKMECDDTGVISVRAQYFMASGIGATDVRYYASHNSGEYQLIAVVHFKVTDEDGSTEAYRPNPDCGTYLGKNADGVMEFDLSVKKGSTEMYMPIVWNNAQGYRSKMECDDSGVVTSRAQYFMAGGIGATDVRYYISHNSGEYQLVAVVHFKVTDEKGSSELYRPSSECGTYLGKNADGVMEFELTIPFMDQGMYFPLEPGSYYTKEECDDSDVVFFRAQYIMAKYSGTTDVRYYASASWDGEYTLVAIVHVTVVMP